MLRLIRLDQKQCAAYFLNDSIKLNGPLLENEKGQSKKRFVLSFLKLYEHLTTMEDQKYHPPKYSEGFTELVDALSSLNTHLFVFRNADSSESSQSRLVYLFLFKPISRGPVKTKKPMLELRGKTFSNHPLVMKTLSLQRIGIRWRKTEQRAQCIELQAKNEALYLKKAEKNSMDDCLPSRERLGL